MLRCQFPYGVHNLGSRPRVVEAGSLRIGPETADHVDGIPGGERPAGDGRVSQEDIEFDQDEFTEPELGIWRMPVEKGTRLVRAGQTSRERGEEKMGVAARHAPVS